MALATAKKTAKKTTEEGAGFLQGLWACLGTWFFRLATIRCAEPVPVQIDRSNLGDQVHATLLDECQGDRRGLPTIDRNKKMFPLMRDAVE
jgi:hypothetical protein